LAAPLPPPDDCEVIAGRFEVEGVIGEGGMGKVLKVRHRRLRKPFALKLMRADVSRDPEWRRLFYREAQLASSLVHPNIVSVVDFGEDKERGLFMVMELLDGELLSSRVERMGQLPVKVACDVAMQLAEALHHSHSQQVVHADIKPDNVLCVRLPSSDRRRWSVKLLDFGMAHLATPHEGQQQTIGGTPAYMAPERIRGHAPQASMDLYGLGILLYEMLTGEVPFDTGDIEGTWHLHLTEKPPLVSAKRVSVDERLVELVSRTLEKEPAHRQRDMAAFIYELRTVMEMLGLRGRRRHMERAPKLRDKGSNERQQAAARTFDNLPIPVAKVKSDGIVVLSNKTFARFIGGDPEVGVAGKNILATSFPYIYPDLAKDLKRVVKSRAAVSSPFEFQSKGKTNKMMLLMKADGDDADACIITLYSLRA
jgi:serine/threonine protein kinase